MTSPMEKEPGYLARAWEDLTSDDNWWQVLLVLGLVNCVPIVGQVITMGYLYDWAKEAAWGMHRPLPREVGDVKRRAKYGLIWLAITLVWTVPVWIVGRLLGMIPGIGPVLHFLCVLVLIVAYVVSAAAVLRGLIYERVLPGLQIDRMLKMASKDVPGLARVFCIGLMTFLVAIVALILVLIPAAPFIASIVNLGTITAIGIDVIPVLVLGILTVVVSLFVWLAATVCATVVLALFTRAMGFWIGQFEPDKWGAPHDPMPFEQADASPKNPAGESAAKADSETDERPVEEQDEEQDEEQGEVQAEEPADASGETDADEVPEAGRDDDA